MIAWFMIAIGTVAFFAYIAITGVQTVEATGSTASRAAQVSRIDQLADAIKLRAAVVDLSGVAAPPAGIPDANGYRVPAELAPLAQTPWGARMVYCPFGSGSSTGSDSQTVADGGGQSYGIGISQMGQRFYVVNGRPSWAPAQADANLMGYIVAPASANNATPGCNQVTLSGGRLVAPGGIVRAISRDTAGDNARRDVAGGPTYYVSTRGGGKGLSPSDPATIAYALEQYRTNSTSDVTIMFANGSYALAASDLDDTQGYSRTPQSTLTLQPQPGATDVSITKPTSSYIRPGFNLTVRNLRMPINVPTVVYRGTTLKLENVSGIGSLQISGESKVVLRGSVGIYSVSPGQGLYPVTISGSSQITASEAVVTVFFYNNEHGIVATTGSSVNLYSTTMTFSPLQGGGRLYYGIYPDAQSKLTMQYSNLYYPSYVSYPIVAYGDVTIFQSSLRTNGGAQNYMEMGNAATVSLEGAIFGGSTPPSTAIWDWNGGSFNGNATVYAQNDCWQTVSTFGKIFARSAPGTATGQTAGVEVDEDLEVAAATNLPATGNPSAAQIAAYQAVVARNQERYALRMHNQAGGVICRIGEIAP
jgi:hypothetical protein